MDFQIKSDAVLLVRLSEQGILWFDDYCERVRDGQQQPRSVYPALGPVNERGQYELPLVVFLEVFGGVGAAERMSIFSDGLLVKIPG
jgi:hypothetical protein